MAEVLKDYLTDIAATPFVYGENDCMCLPLGWFDRVTRKHGLAAWRGRYTDGLSCEQYIHRHGGHVNVAQGFLSEQYGAVECAPKPGNAVLALYNLTKAMGLRVDHRWIAMRTLHGLCITNSVEVIAEWGLA